MNSVPDYTYIHKEVEEYPSSAESSPLETKRMVGSCAFNSLVEHPYKEALSRLGVPAGLVIAKGGAAELNKTSLTREMVQKGGSGGAPVLVSDHLFDELFQKVSSGKTKTRRLTLKKRD